MCFALHYIDMIFSDYRDPIFIFRDPNRVPKMPAKTSVLNQAVVLNSYSWQSTSIVGIVQA